MTRSGTSTCRISPPAAITSPNLTTSTSTSRWSAGRQIPFPLRARRRKRTGRSGTRSASYSTAVTSRSYGDADPLPSQADRYVVRPFTQEQVRVFLDRWYLAAERHATSSSSGRAARRAIAERGRDSAARLASLLRENPALQDLAVNPLLLTMIATAHRYRGALPGNRADLYGEICQVLLSRRAQAKD